LKLQDFKNKHIGKTILVLGLGDSFNDFPLDYYRKFITIGCNDIERLDFTPTYFMFVDTFKDMLERSFDRENERIKWIVETKSDYIFSRPINYPYFKPGQQSKLIDMMNDYVLGRDIRNIIAPDKKPVKEFSYDKLLGSKITPVMAVSLALYMGASKVAFIGVDLCGQHAFGVENKHMRFVESDNIAEIEADFTLLKTKYPDRQIINLSRKSVLTSIQKAVLI
jgi:hypothetical protein